MQTAVTFSTWVGLPTRSGSGACESAPAAAAAPRCLARRGPLAAPVRRLMPASAPHILPQSCGLGPCKAQAARPAAPDAVIRHGQRCQRSTRCQATAQCAGRPTAHVGGGTLCGVHAHDRSDGSPRQQSFLAGRLFSTTARARARRAPVVTVAGFGGGPEWTPDQLAGLAFGVFMVAFVWASLKADVLVARAQRRELGLCERCGGLNEADTCPEPKCPCRPLAGTPPPASS